MNKLMIAIVLVCGISTAEAYSGSNAVMNTAGCASNAATSSGSGKLGTDGSTSNCTCLKAAVAAGYSGCPVEAKNNCGSAETYLGTTLESKQCCVINWMCFTDSAEVQEEVISLNSSGLEDVYETQAERTSNYVGYLNSILRSPTTGRSQDSAAKLDICMGSANVDAASSVTSCYTACEDSSKNGYCTNYNYNTDYTGNTSNQLAGVCKDRCDCKFGYSCQAL